MEAKEHELRNLKFKSAIAETPAPTPTDVVSRSESKQDKSTRQGELRVVPSQRLSIYDGKEDPPFEIAKNENIQSPSEIETE